MMLFHYCVPGGIDSHQSFHLNSLPASGDFRRQFSDNISKHFGPDNSGMIQTALLYLRTLKIFLNNIECTKSYAHDK